MYIEKLETKEVIISTFQGFRGCVIQALKTTKTIKNHKNHKKQKKTQNV